jgi:hypothetical protein
MIDKWNAKTRAVHEHDFDHERRHPTSILVLNVWATKLGVEAKIVRLWRAPTFVRDEILLTSSIMLAIAITDYLELTRNLPLNGLPITTSE